MKKRFMAIMIPAVLAVMLLTGCRSTVGRILKAAGESIAGEESKSPETDGTVQETPGTDGKAADKEENTGEAGTTDKEKADASDKVSPFSPTVLDYSDRFLIGNEKIYYIGDDGTYTNVLTIEENESIAGCAGDDEYFFALIRLTGDKTGYDLYFWHGDDPVGMTGVYVDESVYISRIAVLDHNFYYSYYDNAKSGYSHWYYDPHGDAFLEAEELEDMGTFLSKYKGRDMSVVGSANDIPRMLSDTGLIYVKDDENGLLYSFDRDGVEQGAFDPVLENLTINGCYEDYLVGESYEYDKDGMASTVYTMLYDTRDGSSVELFRRDSREAGSTVLSIKDGFIYYYTDDQSEYGDTLSRSVYRERLKDIWDNVRREQPVYVLNRYSGVVDNYGNYGLHEYGNLGVSILTNRFYFLDFFPDDKEGHQGDVQWCYVDMDGDSVDSERVITDCSERHEVFSDWGTITTVYDVKKDDTDGFVYFKSKLEDFRFHSDVKNADLLNKVMEDAIKEEQKSSEELAGTAYNDILGENAGDDTDWYKKNVGYGYSHERTFGTVKEIGPNYIQLLFDDYDYFGGAHGMPYQIYYLLDTRTGERKTIKDFYKGSEADFKKLVADATVEDWKKDKDYKYYELYAPSEEANTRENFESYVNFDMDIDFSEDKITVYYPPYAVAPFASGFVGIDIPYSELGFSL